LSTVAHILTSQRFPPPAAGPLWESLTGWPSLLRLLAASTTPAALDGTLRLLLSIIAAHLGSSVTSSALEALTSCLSILRRSTAHLGTNLEDIGHPSPLAVLSEWQLVSLLCDLAKDVDASVRGAALGALLAVVVSGADLSVSEVAAVALTAQDRLTDYDDGVAEAARQLLAAVGIPAALLAASGANIDGFQDEPAWRSQVRVKKLMTLSASQS